MWFFYEVRHSPQDCYSVCVFFNLFMGVLFISPSHCRKYMAGIRQDRTSLQYGIKDRNKIGFREGWQALANFGVSCVKLSIGCLHQHKVIM